MNIVVFRHMPGTGLGSIARFLNDRDLPYTVIDTPHADLESFDPLAPDLLIVLGGSPGVYQADIYPFLQAEKTILQARLRADKPTLGICLGGQLMAAALGANVYPGPQGPEYGWNKLSVSAEGMQTPLAHLDGAKTSMLHWHGDTFDLPEGAVLLASSAQYKNQAFSWGKNCIGFQCHPELTPRMVEDWVIGSAGRIAAGTMDPHVIREETKTHGLVLINQMTAFMLDYLTQTGILRQEQRQHA